VIRTQEDRVLLNIGMRIACIFAETFYEREDSMHHDTKYVVDVMTTNPVVVGTETPAWSASCLAQERSVHHLLVIDGYHLVGEVCLCDLDRSESTAPVILVMHSPPLTIDDQKTVEEAAALMMRWRVGCLPVVDWGGELRGVVTKRDLIRAGGLSADALHTCASCGSTHGLGAEVTHLGVAFCTRCVYQGRQPQTSVDETYFQVGGSD
jgi:acetoin utilization protein AcuB